MPCGLPAESLFTDSFDLRQQQVTADGTGTGAAGDGYGYIMAEIETVALINSSGVAWATDTGYRATNAEGWRNRSAEFEFLGETCVPVKISAHSYYAKQHCSTKQVLADKYLG